MSTIGNRIHHIGVTPHHLSSIASRIDDQHSSAHILQDIHRTLTSTCGIATALRSEDAQTARRLGDLSSWDLCIVGGGFGPACQAHLHRLSHEDSVRDWHQVVLPQHDSAKEA